MKKENVLKGIPLYNAFGESFPSQKNLNRLTVPNINVPASQQQPSEMFKPWYKLCNDLIEGCNNHDKSSEDFEKWYEDRYLKNKPHGMRESIVLSPSKKVT
ncbi:hypothetical protein TPHA_0A04900 [Tetrapisispora phaffii CBS 4417]|uniref:Multivesicular body sorting factor 12 domain-containing protein n=1 Tax=Tetrapisispora phaffii (strain ATCC 24235 / CBS 4417 / NBRC 1672 / NRRL Y-8282 / UCD 70-5) TaxID=1071381 RepID=G8BNT7_TETPH|nr:hypothetical protein TPHA_0A04900 [Tetrapisispora phaffii CBS 4417]CCE61565.1 hypothetical protein TPHA_0A04900 [Tetrapisispora phaffii CBS 4417]